MAQQRFARAAFGSGVLPVAAWLCLVSVLVTGYKGLTGANHPLQLVLVQKLLDPTLYPNDLFVQETAFAYASALWYLIAWLSRLVDLSTVLAVFFVASRVLLILAAAWQAKVYFPQSRVAPFAAMAFLASSPSPLIGAGNPIRDFTEQTSFAAAFVLLGFAAFLQQRPLLTAFLLGLAMDMNMMYAFFGMVYLAVAWLVSSEHRNEWRRWFIAAPLMVLVGAPGIWLTLKSGAQPVTDVQAVWQVAELQFPFHFFPVLWHPLLQLLLLGLFGLSWWLARVTPFSAVTVRVHLQVWTLVGMGWYLLAWLTPYVFHSLTLLRLHPIRGHDLWMFTAGIFFAGAAAAWIEHRPAAVPWRFAAQAMILTTAIIWRRIDLLKMSGIAQWIALLVISGALSLGIRAILSRARSNGHNLSAAWAALLTGIIVLSGRAFIWQGQRALAANNWLGNPAPSCQPVAEWARSATQRHDVFLVPFGPEEGWQDFRHLSQRNVFVHWKDGTAWPYAPWYAADWLQRMRLLGLMEVAQLRESDYRTGSWVHVRETFANDVYRQVDEKRVLSLAKQFRIDYWVTYKDIPTQLPIVYQAEKWKVIKLPSSGDASAK